MQDRTNREGPEERFARGDKSAFDELWTKYSETIRHRLLQWCGMEYLDDNLQELTNK